MADAKTEMQFRTWVAALDRRVNEAVGLRLWDLSHLTHLDYRASFDDGMLPHDYFEEVLRYELEDLGFALELNGLMDDAPFEVLLAAQGDGDDYDPRADFA